MTDNDDPFGRRDRTIIRPNPGGRRPIAPPPASPGYPPPTGGAPPVSTPTPPVSYPAPFHPTPQQPSGAANWDGWMTSPTPPAANPYLRQSAPIAPMTPAPVLPHVSVDLVAVAANPMMRASSSLLLLLGRLRASLSRAGAGQLMDQVAQAIQQFDLDARAAGVPGEQVNVAKYALAACADD
ncbi:MAG: DotU family type IV/VI secretion system protein, partial [Hyphomicrobiales bacterium]|nr:DotU family type IV/VI secretion system protein [Hyphomicrobiales bacterium]